MSEGKADPGACHARRTRGTHRWLASQCGFEVAGDLMSIFLG